MRQLSSAGQQAVADIARRHGFSVEATLAMLDAVVRGHGTMAQFSHREFGGSGQWMRGGMTMVGDMFNNQLKGWVDALCQDLANLVASQPEISTGRAGAESVVPGASRPSAFSPSGFGDLFMPGAKHADTWWPSEFGTPNASGSQNDSRYAYFAVPRRLVVQQDGKTTVYDTGEHAIGGVSQQQPGNGNLRFTSQTGTVDLATLAEVTSQGPVASATTAATPPSAAVAIAGPLPADGLTGHDAVFSAIERLAALRERGILDEAEFTSKKAELLRRV